MNMLFTLLLKPVSSLLNCSHLSHMQFGMQFKRLCKPDGCALGESIGGAKVLRIQEAVHGVAQCREQPIELHLISCA